MEALKKTLENFPSSFDVKKYMPKNTEIELMTEKLLLEMKEEGYDTDLEKCRTWNLISFSYWVLEKHTEAIEFNQNVLELDRRNIIGLSNRARYCFDELEIEDFANMLGELKKLKGDRSANLIARSEIAFTLSRLGVNQYNKAKEMYESVIKECETMKKQETKEYICIWLFGYALIQKRQMNNENVMDSHDCDTSPEKRAGLAELYCRIIHLEGRSSCLIKYKARSYADLGWLAFQIEKNNRSYPNGLVGIFPEVDRKPNSTAYFEEALRINRSDAYVLERSGVQYRYVREIERSISLLEEAVALKGTSYSYHHLALSLGRKLDIMLGNVRDRKLTTTENRCRDAQGIERNRICLDEETLTKEGKMSDSRPTTSENLCCEKRERAITLYKRNASAISTATERTRTSLEQETETRKGEKPIRFLKNPQKLKHIDYESNKPVVDRIHECFDKAYQISGNTGALFDKALLYRQLGKEEEAYATLTTLVKNKDGHCSPVQLAKAHEQSAFCLQELLGKGKHIYENMPYYIEMHFKSARELESKLDLPHLRQF